MAQRTYIYIMYIYIQILWDKILRFEKKEKMASETYLEAVFQFQGHITSFLILGDDGCYSQLHSPNFTAKSLEQFVVDTGKAHPCRLELAGGSPGGYLLDTRAVIRWVLLSSLRII